MTYIATMPRWRVLRCTVASLQNWNAVWVTDAAVAQRSEVGWLQGNFRLKPLRERELIALPAVSLNSYYHGAHEQITVLPVATVTSSGGKLL